MLNNTCMLKRHTVQYSPMIYLYSPTYALFPYNCRAESLASEIKEFQGQLADYNTVSEYS